LAAEVAACAMTVAAIHGSRANHAGNFSNAQIAFGQAAMPVGDEQRDAKG